MRNVVASSMIVVCMGGVAGAQPLKTPTGCRVAEGAKASPEGYADLIIHEKAGIQMILVPAGEFTMGSGVGVHQVTIGAPFYLGKTEVTNAQFRRFVEATGYDGTGDRYPAPDVDLYLRHWRGTSIMSPADDYPVVWVNWKNAKAFCQWAGLALPSESQWEYACRGGTTTSYYFGEDKNEFARYGWSNTSQEYHTHSVAGKLPIGWKLYDMGGSIYAAKYGSPPTDGSARLEGKMTKVLKGGSWGNGPVVCGSGSRNNSAPTNASPEFGFRVILPMKEGG